MFWLRKKKNNFELCTLTVHSRYLGSRKPWVDFTITSNKGLWGLMHINGIIIIKQLISRWNFKRTRGSVGRPHVHVGYIFLNSNEEIVVRNPKSKIFLLYIVCCLICCVRFYNLNIFHTCQSR